MIFVISGQVDKHWYCQAEQQANCQAYASVRPNNEVSLLFHARTLLRTIRISTTVATIASTCITGKAHKPKV